MRKRSSRRHRSRRGLHSRRRGGSKLGEFYESMKTRANYLRGRLPSLKLTEKFANAYTRAKKYVPTSEGLKNSITKAHRFFRGRSTRNTEMNADKSSTADVLPTVLAASASTSKDNTEAKPFLGYEDEFDTSITV